MLCLNSVCIAATQKTSGLTTSLTTFDDLSLMKFLQ